MSELNAPAFSKVGQLLDQVEGLELVTLDRKDECCGFGGTFCVAEEALSVRMGQDRVQDHVKNGTQVLTAGDMSCLMHMEGIIRREKLPIKGDAPGRDTEQFEGQGAATRNSVGTANIQPEQTKR